MGVDVNAVCWLRKFARLDQALALSLRVVDVKVYLPRQWERSEGGRASEPKATSFYCRKLHKQVTHTGAASSRAPTQSQPRMEPAEKFHLAPDCRWFISRMQPLLLRCSVILFEHLQSEPGLRPPIARRWLGRLSCSPWSIWSYGLHEQQAGLANFVGCCFPLAARCRPPPPFSICLTR